MKNCNWASTIGWRTLAALATDLPIAPGQVLGAGEMVTTSGSYALKVAFAQAAAAGGGS